MRIIKYENNTDNKCSLIGTFDIHDWLRVRMIVMKLAWVTPAETKRLVVANVWERGKISSLVTQTSRQACDQDQQVWHHAINHLSPLPFHSQSSGLGWRCPATRHYTVISPARGWRQNTMNCVSEPPADQLQLGPGHTLKYHHRPPAQSTTGGRKLLFNSLCEGTNDFWKANLANCCFQNQLELLSFRFMVLNWNIFSGLSALQVDFFYKSWMDTFLWRCGIPIEIFLKWLGCYFSDLANGNSTKSYCQSLN